MMAWHMETARNSKERAVPLSPEQIMEQYAPFREESGDAYALIQHKITDYAQYKKLAFESQDNEALGNILFLRKDVLKTIAFHLEHGYLYPRHFDGGSFDGYAAHLDNKSELLERESTSYLDRSLDLYDKYGADPAVTLASELPSHITVTQGLSPEDMAVKRQFDEVLANGFDALKQRMEKLAKKFGKKTVELFFHSGEITLPPTKILPTVENENQPRR